MSQKALDILVVDDIEQSRKMLADLVRQLGHNVTEVHCGSAALQKVREHQPDLMLLDLLMPDLDGFTVIRRLRELCTDHWLPVIVTSALEGETHFIEALNNGADDYLARPVNSALLEAKLNHYSQILNLQTRVRVLGQRQHAILDNLRDAVVTLDAQGHIEEMNRCARELFGKSRQTSSSVHALDSSRLLHSSSSANTFQASNSSNSFFQKNAKPTCADVLGVALETLKSERECRFRRFDGSEFMAEVGFSTWNENNTQHHTLVLRDLTERHQIERMKDEFLATVSHELRTPLTSILGAIGLLSGGAINDMPSNAKPFLDIALRNGERLKQLISDVLDLTKLEGKRMVLQLRPHSVGALLQESVSALTGYAQRTQIQLVIEGLEEHRDQTLLLDSHRFLQVMANLLSNAIKHSPKGETVKIHVGLGADHSHLRINIKDQGPGISPQFRARLFTKFSQADSTDQRPKDGTGLGLYISRMLIENMHGRIVADEIEGSGASFSLYFPLHSEELGQLGQIMLRPVVIHIEHDFQLRERVAYWLGAQVELHSATSLHTLQYQGNRAIQLIIGNPQSQGSAEEFCKALQKLAGNRPVLLYSDTINASFAQRMNCHWLRTNIEREAWLAKVQPLFALEND